MAVEGDNGEEDGAGRGGTHVAVGVGLLSCEEEAGVAGLCEEGEAWHRLVVSGLGKSSVASSRYSIKGKN